MYDVSRVCLLCRKTGDTNDSTGNGRRGLAFEIENSKAAAVPAALLPNVEASCKDGMTCALARNDCD